jgi:hypothetical protein
MPLLASCLAENAELPHVFNGRIYGWERDA